MHHFLFILSVLCLGVRTRSLSARLDNTRNVLHYKPQSASTRLLNGKQPSRSVDVTPEKRLGFFYIPSGVPTPPGVQSAAPLSKRSVEEKPATRHGFFFLPPVEKKTIKRSLVSWRGTLRKPARRTRLETTTKRTNFETKNSVETSYPSQQPSFDGVDDIIEVEIVVSPSSSPRYYSSHSHVTNNNNLI